MGHNNNYAPGLNPLADKFIPKKSGRSSIFPTRQDPNPNLSVLNKNDLGHRCKTNGILNPLAECFIPKANQKENISNDYDDDSLSELVSIIDPHEIDFSSNEEIGTCSLSFSILNRLAQSFEPNHTWRSGFSNKDILDSSTSINMVPTKSLDSLPQGIGVMQSQNHVFESLEVLDMTPSVLDTVTPNLSISDED